MPPQAALLDAVAVLDDLAGSSAALATHRSEAREVLATLRAQALQPRTETAAIAAALARLRHLTQPHRAENAAGLLFEFASRAPDILHLLQAA